MIVEGAIEGKGAAADEAISLLHGSVSGREVVLIDLCYLVWE